MRQSILVFGVVICLAVLTGIWSPPVGRSGSPADLRWLGGAQASTPATDILAVYTHTSALMVDIRVDLLDINPQDQYKFRLSLWDNRSFFQNPLVIDLSSDGAVRTSGNDKQVIWPRVIQDYGMDTITVSLNRFLIGNRYRMDVTTYPSGSAAPADQARDIHSDGQPPVARAPVLLSFWDTLAADTPAQALRGWDGAHTGPLGGRDGLKYVLDGSKQYKIPLALLDLKTPARLAALDYLGAMAQVQYMNRQGLLILPEVAYAEPGDISLKFSQAAADGFGLPASPYVFNASGLVQPGYAGQFISMPDVAHLALAGGKRFLPLPSESTVEATENGPSLEVRRALVRAMLSVDPADLVVLGGSLPHSTWGQADMVQPTFHWLAGHSWIRLLNADDLAGFPAGAAKPASPPAVAENSPMLQALLSAPGNTAARLAWQDYLWLHAPTNDSQLRDLRANYMGQVESLLAAARWADDPSVQADCTVDLGEDGQADCLLANQSYFAILDPRGARLTNLFYLNSSGLHQLVGPTSQFAVGLSDPSEWHPERGEAADPSVIPGAFADAPDMWAKYSPSVSPAGITFTSADGGRVKKYRLSDKGIEVEYQLSGPEITRIPLAVDPQAYYFGPADYRPAIASHSWTWGAVNGIQVEVSTEAHIAAEGYVSSFPFLSMPEDPNLDYPRGHYFPFPLSIVTVEGEGNFKVEIRVK